MQSLWYFENIFFWYEIFFLIKIDWAFWLLIFLTVDDWFISDGKVDRLSIKYIMEFEQQDRNDNTKRKVNSILRKLKMNSSQNLELNPMDPPLISPMRK